jgi:hypothetical protein
MGSIQAPGGEKNQKTRNKKGDGKAQGYEIFYAEETMRELLKTPGLK